MFKRQRCLCLVAITVSLVGCNSKMEPRNVLVRALTLPTKLAGTSKYETAMDILMRRIESTDQYRSALEYAQLQGKGISRCAVVMHVTLSSGFGKDRFFTPVDELSDDMFGVHIVAVLERGGRVGYTSNLAGAILPWAGKDPDMSEMLRCPLLDGWVCRYLSPIDSQDNARSGWPHDERLQEMHAIRDGLRRATAIREDGVAVFPFPRVSWDGAEFFLVSVGNGDHVRRSVGINGLVDLETYNETLRFWHRIWSAVNLKRAGDRDPGNGPAPGDGD